MMDDLLGMIYDMTEFAFNIFRRADGILMGKYNKGI